MIAVDTSVWIDFLRDHRTGPVRLLRELIRQKPESIALVDITFAEILRGLNTDQAHEADRLLSLLNVLQSQWKQDYKAAAGLHRAARSAGLVVHSTIGCLIAAVCIRENVPLLHSDADFTNLAQIAPLSVVNIA